MIVPLYDVRLHKKTSITISGEVIKIGTDYFNIPGLLTRAECVSQLVKYVTHNDYVKNTPAQWVIDILSVDGEAIDDSLKEELIEEARDIALFRKM